MNQSKKYNHSSNSRKLTILSLVLASNQLFAAFELKKYTINSGGTESTSQRYQLNGSIAQVDANTTLSSNSYQLTSGFWQENSDLIFLNEF